MADAVLALVSDGLTLKDSCLGLGLDVSHVRRWIRDDAGGDSTAQPPAPGMQARYYEALRQQAESMADDIVQIADESTDEESTVSKMRIEVRKWLAAKNHPRFADKSTVVHAGDAANPVRTFNTTTTLDEAADLYRQARDRGREGA